jgi:trigger factor
MKKYFCLILAAVLLACLCAGCGASATDDSAEYLKDIKAENYVTLGEYKGLSLSLSPYEVTETDIDGYIEMLMSYYPMVVSVDGPSQSGDEVNIDFVGKLDGVAFENGSATGYTYTLGSYQFISDLDAGMVGMMVGEERDIEATFPDPYSGNPDLAGKLTVFTVTMNSISRTKMDSNFDDEYVVFLTGGEYTNTADFRVVLGEELRLEAENTFEISKADGLAALVLETAEFNELPEGFVARFIASLTNSITYYASMYGMDLETYMYNAGATENYGEGTKVIREIAENNARQYLAYQVIANKEGLNVNDNELDRRIEEAAAAESAPIEQYRASVDLEAYREYLMFEKVSLFLEENATIIVGEAGSE